MASMRILSRSLYNDGRKPWRQQQRQPQYILLINYHDSSINTQCFVVITVVAVMVCGHHLTFDNWRYINISLTLTLLWLSFNQSCTAPPTNSGRRRLTILPLSLPILWPSWFVAVIVEPPVTSWSLGAGDDTVLFKHWWLDSCAIRLMIVNENQHRMSLLLHNTETYSTTAIGAVFILYKNKYCSMCQRKPFDHHNALC